MSGMASSPASTWNHLRRVDLVTKAKSVVLTEQELAKAFALNGRQGNVATVTGIDPNGGTQTLPDGTTRPMACYNVTIK
jgi:hypothetical protein